MKINFEKLTLSVVAWNVVSWLLFEYWYQRFEPTTARDGAGVIVVFQIIGYAGIIIGTIIQKANSKPQDNDN